MLDRWVHFRVRAILTVIAVVLAVWVVLSVVSVARQVITWMLISLFFALALNPSVEFFVRRGMRRGLSAAITYVLALAFVGLIGFLFIPTLISNVNNFVDALPGYVEDLTEGRGKLGFLQERYHVVDRVKDFVSDGGAARLFGLSGAALELTRSILTVIVAIVTIIFMTFFMLLEGPRWMERIYSLLPLESQPRWRQVGYDIYRTVGGYVTGNLLISVIAGVSYTIVMLIVDIPFAVALGLLVAILDLIPLAGATIATIVVGAVGFLESLTAGIVIVAFALIYQQIENHVLQPLIYGRTVQLSPLMVLIAVLIGAQVAGVIGALGAIPLAGALQVIIVDYLRARRERAAAELTTTTLPPRPPET
jgi:predicted PurR-regulated permease PerM